MCEAHSLIALCIYTAAAMSGNYDGVRSGRENIWNNHNNLMYQKMLYKSNQKRIMILISGFSYQIIFSSSFHSFIILRTCSSIIHMTHSFLYSLLSSYALILQSKVHLVQSSTFPFVHCLQILSSLFSTSTHLYSQFSSPPPPPQLVLSAHNLQTCFLLTCTDLVLHWPFINSFTTVPSALSSAHLQSLNSPLLHVFQLQSLNICTTSP